MIHSGGIGFKHGWADDGLGAFLDPKDPAVDLRSVTVEEKDGVVLYELETEDNFYRAEKLPIYHDKDNVQFGSGELLGKLDVTPEFDTVPDAEEVNEQPDAWHNVVIEEDEDRMVFHGRFERGALAIMLPVAYVVVGIAPEQAVFGPWATSVPWMFLGGILMANCIESIGLLKRVAYWCIIKTGGTYNRIL